MKLLSDYKNKYKQLMNNDEYQKFIKSYDDDAVKGFRINPLKDNLEPKNVVLDNPTEIVNGYYGEVSGHNLDYVSGLLYSQDPSAMYVADILNAEPGNKVLDLCAAPGSKTTQIAGFMQQKGVLVSNEINKKRCKILTENVERSGIKNCLILNESPQKIAKNFADYFDRVLVDAPCSGEGMFRKDPSAMDYWNSNYPKECSVLQKEILTQAIKTVKDNGILVYSTCTFSPEEDESNVIWLLNHFEQLTLLSINGYKYLDDGRVQWVNDSRVIDTKRLFPHHFKGEGHFIAKFKVHKSINKDNLSNKKVKMKKSFSLNKEQIDLWNEFQSNNLTFNINCSDLIVINDYLYWPVIKDAYLLQNLSVKRNGLLLGVFKKKRFEPSHALAMYLHCNQSKYVVELNEKEARTYLHGDVLSNLSINTPIKDKSWVLITYNQNSLGFGRYVNNVIKNYYPKGLRF